MHEVYRIDIEYPVDVTLTLTLYSMVLVSLDMNYFLCLLPPTPSILSNILFVTLFSCRLTAYPLRLFAPNPVSLLVILRFSLVRRKNQHLNIKTE